MTNDVARLVARQMADAELAAVMERAAKPLAAYDRRDGLTDTHDWDLLQAARLAEIVRELLHQMGRE